MREIKFNTGSGEWSAATAPAPADLRPMVAELWEVRGAVGYGYEKLIPSGFAEFMVNLGPPHRVLESRSLAPEATFRRSWISGLRDRPLFTAPMHGNGSFRTHLTAARLTPLGVYALFGIAGCELANTVLEAKDALGPSVDDLRDLLAESRSVSLRFEVLAAFLRECVRRRDRRLPVAAEWAVGETLTQNGDVRVGHLCVELGISRKHLNSLYQLTLGLSPKTYARLVRFRSVMARLKESDSPAWARIAADLGYFDQAHMVREFSAFAGESPTAFLTSNSPDRESVVYESEPPHAR